MNLSGHNGLNPTKEMESHHILALIATLVCVHHRVSWRGLCDPHAVWPRGHKDRTALPTGQHPQRNTHQDALETP